MQTFLFTDLRSAGSDRPVPNRELIGASTQDEAVYRLQERYGDVTFQVRSLAPDEPCSDDYTLFQLYLPITDEHLLTQISKNLIFNLKHQWGYGLPVYLDVHPRTAAHHYPSWEESLSTPGTPTTPWLPGVFGTINWPALERQRQQLLATGVSGTLLDMTEQLQHQAHTEYQVPGSHLWNTP